VLEIPDNVATSMRELLTGEEAIVALTYTCPFQCTLPGYSAKLLKVVY